MKRVVLALLFAACGSTTNSPGTSAPAKALSASSLSVAAVHGQGHMMPVASLRPAKSKTNPDTLSYYGGPVLSNVKVFIVEWGKAVTIPSATGNATAAELGSFFSGVTDSSYFSWLAEYNTPTETIGAGSYIGSYVDTAAPSGSTIDDAVIQSELSRLVAAGSVPANDGNTLYFVYFPAGIDVTMGGSASCEVFCAYHGTGADSAQNNLYYAVLPDQGGSCAGGCGDASNQFDNTTSVSSHELVEAVTDAAVGIASALDAPPLAWYNDTNGEIGDICNAEQSTVKDTAGKTWTVQKLWSNFDNACVTTSSAPAGSGASN